MNENKSSILIKGYIGHGIVGSCQGCTRYGMVRYLGFFDTIPHFAVFKYLIPYTIPHASVSGGFGAVWGGTVAVRYRYF
jgi:hypothetical protein